MDWLLQIHSIARWLVLAAAVAALGKFAIGLLARAAFTRADNIVGLVFTGLLDAQALLGVALLAGQVAQAGGQPGAETILHAVSMFFAVAAAHQTARWRDAPPARRFRNGLLAYGLALVLVVLGIVVIVQSP
jgi:hypothetical protein